VGTLVAGARPQEASAGAATPIFAAGMEAATTDITPTPPPDTPGMPTPETMEQTMEQLGAHIAYWATQGNQRASLTIGDSQNNPLGVNISFDNGEVHVHFETDEAEVQEALSLSAEEMLNRMLEARGLTLGDVSIGAGQGEQRSAPQGGANHPGDPQQGSDDSPRALAARADTPTRGNTGTGGSLGRPAGVISANKLDFFA
jgi:flagellar hook-length control protein FliK